MSNRPKLYPQQCPTERNAAGLRMCPYVLCRHNLVADRVDIERLFSRSKPTKGKSTKRKRPSPPRLGDMTLLADDADDDAAELIARECERPLFSCSLDFADVEWQRLQEDDEAEFDGTVEWGGRPQRGTAYAVPTESIGQQMGFTGERIRQVAKEAEVKMAMGLELPGFGAIESTALQSVGCEPHQGALCGGELVRLQTTPDGETLAIAADGRMELAAYVEDGRVVWEEPFGLDEPGEVWCVEWAKKAKKGAR